MLTHHGRGVSIRLIVVIAVSLGALQAYAQGYRAAYQQNNFFAEQSRLAAQRSANASADLAHAVEQSRAWARMTPAPSYLSPPPSYASPARVSGGTPAGATSLAGPAPAYDPDLDPLAVARRILASVAPPEVPARLPSDTAEDRRDAERRAAQRRDIETLQSYFGTGDRRAAVARVTALAEQGNAAAALVLGIAHLNGDGAPQDSRKAFDWMQRSARAGEPAAQVLLGEMYMAGVGVKADTAAALEQFDRAAATGYAPAQLRLAQGLLGQADRSQGEYPRALRAAESAMETLPKAGFEAGLILLSGRPGVPRDPPRATAALQRAAAAGHAQAQYMLGMCHEAGIGLSRSPAAALPWFVRAAEQGVPVAQLRAGEIYAFGLGVAPDRAKGLRWLEAAAQGGEIPAHNLLGVVLSAAPAAGELPRAIQAFRTGADLGDPAAQMNLGVALLSGIGLTADAAQAAHWLTRSADAGHATAQYVLGLMHVDGKAVVRDDGAAVRRFTQAAGQGHARALDELCDLAHQSRGGVSQNDPADPPWLASGVRERQPVCLYVAAIRIERGIGGARDPQRAVALLRQAAELGDHRAEFNLGQLYLMGRYLPVDPEQGRMWVTRAADHGNTAALAMLRQAGWR